MSPRTVLLAAALLAAAPAPAGPALAPAPFAGPPVGARFHWRNLDSGEVGIARVVATDGIRRIWDFEGSRRDLIPFCTGCTEEGMRYPFEDYRALWPLEVGRTAEFKRTREGDAWRNRVEVVGTETLELELGPVDTYVLEVDSTGITFEVSTWSRRSRVWYAPSLAGAVRIETDFRHGRMNERRLDRWEIVAHERP